MLIAAISGTPDISEKAFEVLDDPERVFVSSDIVRLETSVKSYYNKHVDAIAFYEEYFASTVALEETNPSCVAEALELGKQFGVAGMDALVASAAIRLEADEFISSEKPSKPMFRITSDKTKFISLRTASVPALLGVTVV